MNEAKSVIWAGFDVGKASFVAALDEATASERRKVTSLPCREFKRNQDEVKKFFRWTKEEFSTAEVRIVMETTGCYSQHLQAPLLKMCAIFCTLPSELAFFGNRFGTLPR